MKLYLTTSSRSEKKGYICRIHTRPPRFIGFSDGTGWWNSLYGDKLFAGYCPGYKLARLGFPPPGKMRAVEIGEYKEGE